MNWDLVQTGWQGFRGEFEARNQHPRPVSFR